MGFMGRRGYYVLSEILLRLLIIAGFLCTESMKPFQRIIQPEEWFLYKNPIIIDQHINTTQLYLIAIFCPLLIILIFSGVFRTLHHDFLPASLAASLSFTLNGLVTNCIKLCVGRPRPDFFFRCYPDGKPPQGQPSTFDLVCTGDNDDIIEGRKSFPSGHSSYSFTSLGFCALFMCGKLHCFTQAGRGRSWRLCLGLAPLLVAVLVAMSRTMDYRHHWQDVIVGSILGLLIACLAYYQHYPPLSSDNPHLPYMTSDREQKEMYTIGSSGNLLAADSVKHM